MPICYPKPQMPPLAHDAAAFYAECPLLAGGEFAYLDSAATTPRLRAGMDAEAVFLQTSYANVHRGAHPLGDRATAAYEGARAQIARFCGAGAVREVSFTKNATEALNALAHIIPGSGAVVVTSAEHHSNFLPWMARARRLGADFRILEVDAEGRTASASALADALFGASVFAFSAKSNVTGAAFPVAEYCAAANKAGAHAVCDACQFAPMGEVGALLAAGVSGLALSAHKIYGPSGLGMMWLREDIGRTATPFLMGGEMIASVADDDFKPAPSPHRFEAGTPPIAAAVGFSATLAELENRFPRAARAAHTAALAQAAYDLLSKNKKLRIVSSAHSESLITFFHTEINAHDLGDALGAAGLYVRAGNHCTEPLHSRLGVSATVRASFGPYNTLTQVEQLARFLENPPADL